jgi:putative tricarboxylic transport membrane protein
MSSPTPPPGPDAPAASTDGRSGDVVAGGIFVALGLAFSLASLGYGLGSWNAPGAGMFPLAAGAALTVLGVVIALAGLRGKGETTPGLTRLPWRGFALVLGALVFFAYGIASLGLIITTAGTTLLACLASRTTSIVQAVLATAGITIFCYLVFVLALQLRLPLYP